MRIVIAAAILALAAPQTWAGCSNYTDGSLTEPAPRVTICFDGVCEETTVDFECGNVHGAQIGYANGLRIELSVDDDPVIYRIRTYTPEEFAKITCEPVENCAGFPID